MLFNRRIPTKVYFPVDCKTGRAKREYTKASKIKIYNKYEQNINNIPKLEDVAITKLFLESITRFYTNEELACYFDISLDDFQSILESFNVE